MRQRDEHDIDDDLRREVIDQRLARARAHQNRTAWDEPPGFYDDATITDTLS